MWRLTRILAREDRRRCASFMMHSLTSRTRNSPSAASIDKERHYNKVNFQQSYGAGHERVAVVVSGARLLPRPNPVIGMTAAATWAHHLQTRPGQTDRNAKVVSFFLCVAAPPDPLMMQPVRWSGSWTFRAQSQFERLLKCLQLIESDWPRHHSAFLRLRPDALVFGPLPSPLLPDQHAFYGKYYHWSHRVESVTRDEVDCGMCDQDCNCFQRKYGQVLYSFTRKNCAVVTDRVFLFGRAALPRMLTVLSNLSNTTEHPMRSRELMPHLCIDAGVMVETGFSRLLEVQRLDVLPLRFRTVLERSLQPDTPGWASVACIFTWGDDPVPCNAPCGNGSTWLAARGLPIFPTLRGRKDAGCNAISRRWYPS